MAKKSSSSNSASRSKSKSGSHSLLKWLCASIAILVFLIGAATVAIRIYAASSPEAAYRVNYYTLEAKDWVRHLVGLDPHYDNLDLGAPEGGEVDRIFNREGYAYGYSERYEQPLWVTYKLTAEELPENGVYRTNDFREDPRILTHSASPEDYIRSGYDRGHLAPAADMSWNKTVMSESFYMSNMSPQRKELNRGIWKDLESETRKIAKREREIYVVVGPLFDPVKKIKVIGANRVAVPHAYYKVLYDLTPPKKMIGFILPNEGSKDKLRVYALPVSDVERIAGLKFFPKMEPGEASILKSSIDAAAWGL